MGFAAAGEESLVHFASQEDMRLIAHALEDASRAFVEGGLTTEARALITAHILLGTSPHQVTSETINIWPHSATALAVVERVAEDNQVAEIAQEALAAWALVVAYMEVQFGREHPSKTFSLDRMGTAPPWDAARRVIRSPEWQRVWTNKMAEGFAPVEPILDWAEEQHRARTVGP